MTMTSYPILNQAIADVAVWRKGDQCAPHKPLLILYVLSQYKKGHHRLFNYGDEIQQPLTQLLQEFGPKRRDYYPNMPFWRLRTESFWCLENAERCKPRKGNTQPLKRELTEHQVSGGFDEESFRALNQNPAMIDKLAQNILTERFPESLQQVLADQLGFDIITLMKTRDPRFRESVLRAYHSQCAVCGYNLRLDGALVGLEAAHIRWKQYGGPCEVSNGLALCSVHHSALDRGAIGVDEHLTIRISGGINRSPMVDRLFRDLEGKKLLLPGNKAYWPADKFIEWHQTNVFKA